MSRLKVSTNPNGTTTAYLLGNEYDLFLGADRAGKYGLQVLPRKIRKLQDEKVGILHMSVHSMNLEVTFSAETSVDDAVDLLNRALDESFSDSRKAFLSRKPE